MYGLIVILGRRLFTQDVSRNWKKKKKGTYVIAYWGENESYDDAVDFEVSVYELAADFICQDLTLS